MEKTLLFEMGVKGKGVLDSEGAHDFETDTIDKAQVSSLCQEKSRNSGSMGIRGNKFHIDGREKIFLKGSNSG